MIYTQYFIGFPTNEIKRKESKRKRKNTKDINVKKVSAIFIYLQMI